MGDLWATLPRAYARQVIKRTQPGRKKKKIKKEGFGQEKEPTPKTRAELKALWYDIPTKQGKADGRNQNHIQRVQELGLHKENHHLTKWSKSAGNSGRRVPAKLGFDRRAHNRRATIPRVRTGGSTEKRIEKKGHRRGVPATTTIWN